MKKYIATLALTLAIAAPLAAERKRPAGNPHSSPLTHCLQVIDLSEAQKAQIKTILDSSAGTMRGLHDALRTDREALRRLLEATTPDACAIGAATLKVQAGEKAIKNALDATRAAVEGVLTPDQKLKFSGCMDALRNRPGDDKGPRD